MDYDVTFNSRKPTVVMRIDQDDDLYLETFVNIHGAFAHLMQS